MARKKKPKLVKSPFKKEKSSFRLSKNNLKNLRKRYLNYVMGGLLVIAFFIASYFGVSYLSSQPGSDPNKERIEIGSFDDTLLNGTPVQLVNSYNELERTAMSRGANEMPMIIDAFKKRLKLSDRMIEIAEDDETQADGLSKKIRVLSQWDFANVTIGIDDPATRALLLQSADKALAGNSEPLIKLGQAVKTIIGVYDFANEPEGKTIDSLVDAFTETAESLTDDVELAQVMIRSCTMLAKKNLRDEAGQLLGILSEALSKSDDKNIRQLASTARKSWLLQKYGLVEIATELDVDRADALKKIHEAVDDLSAKPDSGHENAELIFQLMQSMTYRNLIDDVRQDLPKLGQIVAKLETDPNDVTSNYEALAGQVSAFNQTLDLTSLQSTTGQRFPIEAFSDSAKIIYFWSPESQKSIDSMLALHRQNEFFRRKSIVVLTVFVDKTNSGNDMTVFRDQAADLENLSFYRADQNDEKGKSLLKQFPVNEYPTMVVLDDKNRVRAINPIRDRLRSVVEKVLLEVAERGRD